MNNCVFVGCSLTSGYGFDLGKSEPNLWVNILHSTNTMLRSTNCVNLGQEAISNQEIFKIACESFFKYQPTTMFVQWTSYPRYSVLLSVETYTSCQGFVIDIPTRDQNLHSIKYPAEYLDNIRDRFLSLHHPHAGIVEVVSYTNILINIAKICNVNLFFVNGICPWDKNYFQQLRGVLPSEYTEYTQTLLESTTRDDTEVQVLYEKIHSDYNAAGSIQERYWLNLYDSLLTHKIDTNNDNLHPGIKSNHLYASLLNKKLINKLSS